MWRCHTSPSKGKSWNLISSNSVADVYLLGYWLANPNVHRLLKTVHLSTPALPRRLSVIFLWEELSQRALIPILNTLLDIICIVGGRWGAHSYLALLKNNRVTYLFWNRLLSLCWLFHNMMTNWNYFKRINDECVWTLIFDRHWHVFFLTWLPTNSKWRVVLYIKIKI